MHEELAIWQSEFSVQRPFKIGPQKPFLPTM